MFSNTSSKGSYFKYYLPSFLFFVGSTFIGVFATLIVVLYPVSMFIYSILPIIGFFLITYLYISFEDLRVTQQIKLGELTDKKIQDINTFYNFWKISFYIISVILLFAVPAYLLVNRSNLNSNSTKISNNTFAFTQNDTIILKMFSEVPEIMELKLLYSDSVLTTSSLENMTLLDYPVIAAPPFYTCKIPNKSVPVGFKHFYFVDVNNSIIGSSNALNNKHATIVTPKFNSIKTINNDLFIKFENPSFNSCFSVMLNCISLKNDYTVTFKRPLLLIDSITVPIRHNDIYRLELIIIDSLNHHTKVDSTVIVTNKK